MGTEGRARESDAEVAAATGEREPEPAEAKPAAVQPAAAQPVQTPPARRPGKLPGAPGIGRTQVFQANAEQAHYLDTCAGCGRPLEPAGAVAYTGFQAVDLRWDEPGRPVVCLDETSKQLVAKTRTPLPAAPGQPERVDYEYERRGTANLFLSGEPWVGHRHVTATERRAAVDFAREGRDLLEVRDPHAEQVVLVTDNPNKHKPAALCQAFEPAVARALLERLEMYQTPKHGSWLNVAEIELNVLSRQCLDRHIPDAETPIQEVAAWEQTRNANLRPVNWRFTTPDARLKFKRLYLSIQDG